MIEVLMTPTSELSDNIVYDDMEQEELKVKQAKEGLGNDTKGSTSPGSDLQSNGEVKQEDKSKCQP